MFVVVTTFYTLDGMKSILLPEFVFFRSRLRLSLKNTNSIFYCFIFVLRGCCTSYYNIPSSLPEGALGCAPRKSVDFSDKHCFCGHKSDAPREAGQFLFYITFILLIKLLIDQIQIPLFYLIRNIICKYSNHNTKQCCNTINDQTLKLQANAAKYISAYKHD